MSSFNRQHHGRPQPPPAWNQSGYHPPSTTAPQEVDPHYLYYLQSQADQLNFQISKLSNHRNSSRYQAYQPQATMRHRAPAQVSLPSSSRQQRHHKPQRNHAREKSKWRFYAVKNGLNGDDVYSSWGQAHPFCWDPTSGYFFQGCFCKGFNSYDCKTPSFLLNHPNL